MSEAEPDNRDIVDNTNAKELCKCREYKEYYTNLLWDMLQCKQITRKEYDDMVAGCKASYNKHEQELAIK